jgi:spore maturation protein CgeB
MKIRLFYHSLLSDWNHGNAHFLRGVVTDLQARGHDVVVYEPRDGWSLSNLKQEHGEEPLRRLAAVYPGLQSVFYDPASFEADEALADADLVIVHEWNDHAVVRMIGEVRKRRDFVLLFHDTHHRLITERERIQAYDFTHYDGVLAYGKVLRDIYVSDGLIGRAWTWHEAADTRVFHPISGVPAEGDLVWIGNWGDDERSEELHEFLIEPVRALGLKARIYGVRYPDSVKETLAKAGIEYGGWLPNFEAPRVFAGFKMTVHVPRRPYVEALRGIPTIRPFEALACGIPLVCSPWNDAEKLFARGKDYLAVRDGAAMKKTLRALAGSPAKRKALADHGLATIRRRHTCAHRVDELLAIHAEVRTAQRPVARRPSRSAPIPLPAAQLSSM